MEDERIEEQQEQTEEQQEQQEERLFTQEEVDAIINKRMARFKKNQPSDEELAEFREWKSAKNPKESATQSDLDSALAEMEMTRRENYLLRKGIAPDDVDYYVYKISKSMDGETDFEDAAEEFLKSHKPQKTARFDTGARMNTGSGKKTSNEAMNELIRNAKN